MSKRKIIAGTRAKARLTYKERASVVDPDIVSDEQLLFGKETNETIAMRRTLNRLYRFDSRRFTADQWIIFSFSIIGNQSDKQIVQQINKPKAVIKFIKEQVHNVIKEEYLKEIENI